MPKYLIPIIAYSTTEIEAKNLEDAVLQINNGDPDIPGINTSEVSSWEINQKESFEKDKKVIEDEDGDLLHLCDIKNPTEY